MRKKKTKILCIVLAVALVLTALTVYTAWSNTAIAVRTIEIKDKKIPSSFSGFKIAHISDLHNDEFGEFNKELIGLIKAQNPDIIAITGDLVDRRDTRLDIGFDFAKAMCEIAPTYYIPGNHEANISGYDSFKADLKTIGVKVLEDIADTINIKGQSINIVGILDKSFYHSYYTEEEYISDTKATLGILMPEEQYDILLAHNPELFDLYTQTPADLVLTGHVHGGQFRLPFVGGILSPSMSFFPKYDSGLYEKNGVKMIVSRGIGNSAIPLRFNNRPEIIIAELKNEE